MGSMDASVNALCINPGADTLFVGGGFMKNGNKTLNYIGALNTSNWYAMGMDMGSDYSMIGTNGKVLCMQPFQGKLYLGGDFSTAESFAASHIAYYQNGSFGSVGNGFDNVVRCLAVYNGELYAGGEFKNSGTTALSHIAKWNGSTWVAVGAGLNDDVEAMTVYNGRLIVGGDFDQSGTTTLNHIAQWDGSNWSALGTGITTNNAMISMGMPAMVHCLQAYHGKLYAGGMFMYADGKDATNLAVWNDTAWSSLGNVGTKMLDVVESMTTYNYKLIIGGYFDQVGSLSAANIAAWNGTTWSTLGAGVDTAIACMAAYKGTLVIGGYFKNVNAKPMSYLAQWQEPAGINQNHKNDLAIAVFPNPGSDFFNISGLQNEKNVVIKINSLDGKLIYQEHVENPSTQTKILLGKIPNGMYTLYMESEQHYAVQKLIILN